MPPAPDPRVATTRTTSSSSSAGGASSLTAGSRRGATPAPRQYPRGRRLRLVLLAVAILTAGSCARQPLVIPVSITAGQSKIRFRSLQSYESAVPTIARLLVGEFGLPLPARLTVFVYPTHVAYAEGLAKLGHMRTERAAQIAGYAIGLYQRERLFINDGALRGACVAVWLGLIAHELTHAAQYELSSGRRGRSEQWIREGMADWVAMRVLDRLGVRDGRHRRDQALNEIRQDRGSSYEIAFLMTDVLIERHGLESIVAYFRAFATSDDRFGNFSRAFGVSL